MQITAKCFETTLQMKCESCRLYRVALIDGQAICCLKPKCRECMQLTFLLRNQIDPSQELWKCERRRHELFKATRKA